MKLLKDNFQERLNRCNLQINEEKKKISEQLHGKVGHGFDME